MSTSQDMQDLGETLNVGGSKAQVSSSISAEAASASLLDRRYNEVYQISAHNAFTIPTPDKPGLLWQLENNIFSLELDIHTKKDFGVCPNVDTIPADLGEWFVFHDNCSPYDDLVEQRPDNEVEYSRSTLSACLQTLKQWHQRPSNQNHPVVTLWIDLKLEAPPFSSTGHSAVILDTLFKNSLGADSIFTPGDLMQMTLACRSRHGAEHLYGTVKNCRWPKMRFLRGKFIVVLTGGGLLEYLCTTDNDRMAFIAPKASEIMNENNEYIRLRSAFYNVGDCDQVDEWALLPKVLQRGLVGRVYKIKNTDQWQAAKEACYHHIATDLIRQEGIEHGQHPLLCKTRLSVSAVVNQTREAALSIFADEADDLILNFREQPMPQPPFNVVGSTDPVEGTEVTAGTSVDIVVYVEAIADGAVIKGSGPVVYLKMGGKRYGATTERRLNEWGHALTEVVQIPDENLNAIPDGGILPPAPLRPEDLGDDRLLREEHSLGVYVMYGGAKFHIPNMDAFNALEFNLDNIREAPDGSLAAVPGSEEIGPPPPHSSPLPWSGAADGTLKHRQSSGTIYVIYGGAKFGIPNMEVFNALGFHLSNVNPAPDSELDNIPDVPRDGTLLREQNGKTICVVYGGAKFGIPNMDVFRTLGYHLENVRVIPDGKFPHIPDTPRDGTVLKEQSNPSVYIMQGGAKRGVINEYRFHKLGYSWSELGTVPDGALAQARFPSGPAA